MADKKPTKFEFNDRDFNKFYRYCISLTRNEDDAFDLLQSSLEKFLSKGGKDKDYPNSYLYTIIRNGFIDKKRRSQRWKEYSIDDRENSNVALIDLEALNEEQIVSNDQVKRIMSAVNGEDRELLYLWAVEGQTIRSISQKFDIPRGTLLSRLHRLKKRLRQILIREYPELKLGQMTNN